MTQTVTGEATVKTASSYVSAKVVAPTVVKVKEETPTVVTVDKVKKHVRPFVYERPFTVTIKRGGRYSDLFIRDWRKSDLMEYFLKKARKLDKNINQGPRTRMTFSIDDNEETDGKVKREPLQLIAFHDSVKRMHLWEVGISAANSTVAVKHLINES
jgi:hypothetical protein